METIHIYTEADSKGSLLAEVHRLQSSLAAMRQARDFHGANSAERMREWDRLQKEKDLAYSERDRLVCALSKLFPSHMERHPDSDTAWDDDWRWIVFIQLPTGQASWHIYDSERGWFDHLTVRDGSSWDGHSTAEKYCRLERIDRIVSMTMHVQVEPKP